MPENTDPKKDIKVDRDKDKMGQQQGGQKQGLDKDKDIGLDEDKVTQRNPRQGGQGGMGGQNPR